MHPNPSFRKVGRTQCLAFARARGFGLLSVNGPEGPLAAHVPFEIDGAGEVVTLHLVRSNPVWRALLAPLPALLAVSGPDGYVSPDWYGVPDQVPTWNYVAVHLRGTLARAPEAGLRGVLDGLSAEMEGGIAGKAPWTAEKMSPGVMEKMMRAIAPVTLRLAEVDGTWKLNQNKPDAVRLAAAGRVHEGRGSELGALAALMRAPPEPEEP